MKPAADDLANRRLAWDALSDLYLDTDTSSNRNWRVKKLLESPYTIDELERILVEEVHPVCRWNLMCVAGEWAGFDLDCLQERILAHLKRRSWFRFRLFSSERIRSNSEWIATKNALASSRAQSSDSGSA